MGEAAGAVAAIAALSSRQPHKIPWAEASKAIAKVREKAGSA